MGIIKEFKIFSRQPAKYAWTTVLFNGDLYLPGAMVVAQSLRDVQTAHDIVCMVDQSVSDTAVDSLYNAFDRVFLVDTIRTNSGLHFTNKQRNYYSAWIDTSCTKWNALYLVDYDKVIYIDSDHVVSQNMDNLAELGTPAAVFSTPWAYPYAHGGYFNPYIIAHMLKNDIPHGAKISATLWRTIATSRRVTFAPCSSLAVIKPSISDAEQYTSWITSQIQYCANANIASGIDEVSIFEYYAGMKGMQWSNIHQQYSAIPWKTKWANPKTHTIYAHHYFGEKPWLMNRSQWPDLEEWYTVADRLGICPVIHAHALL